MDKAYKNLKILSSTWYYWPSVACLIDAGGSKQQIIGIVSCQDTLSGEKKRFIGLGKGENQLADEINIIEMGTPFYG